MLTPMSVPDRRARATALLHPSSQSTDRGGAGQPGFEKDRYQGPHQACRTVVTHDHHPAGPQEFRCHHYSYTIQTYIVVQFEAVRSLGSPPAPGHTMVGGLRFSQKFGRAPFSISSVRQLLRPRCDARLLKPLPIEIIARQKVSPAFEPQNVSGRTAPGIRVQCYGCLRSIRVVVLPLFSTSGLRRLIVFACRLIEERLG
jgi:hypothetical protein